MNDMPQHGNANLKRKTTWRRLMLSSQLSKGVHISLDIKSLRLYG